MKNYSSIIMPLYFLSILFAISSNSWMSIWIGMELNLLSFIFIMVNPKTMNSNESTMKYFLIQAIGSMMFLISLGTHMSISYNNFNVNDLVPPLALMLKSGLAPLHLWIPNITKKISPPSLFLLVTFQKIVPILIMVSSWSTMIKWLIPINLMMGAIGGLTQSSIHQLIVFSSINNSGWMLMSAMESNFMFSMFFFIYMALTANLIWFIYTNKMKWMAQIKTTNLTSKFLFTSNMFSMSGLPPFVGFIPKWLILKKSLIYIPSTCLWSVMMSTITMFFYIKYSVNFITHSSISKKWETQSNYNSFLIYTMFFNLFTSPLVIFFN